MFRVPCKNLLTTQQLTDEIQCEDLPGEDEYNAMMEFVADCQLEDNIQALWEELWEEIRQGKW